MKERIIKNFATSEKRDLVLIPKTNILKIIKPLKKSKRQKEERKREEITHELRFEVCG